MTEPPIITEQELYARRVERANIAWRQACVAHQEAQRELDAAYDALRRWRQEPGQFMAAWDPILTRLSAELGTRFVVVDNGGGTRAISAEYGPLRVMVTDWQDGDLSHPEAGTGWWVGFTLPDTRWTGIVESLVGAPFARTADDLIKLVAYAVSGYYRGERYPCRAPSEEGMAVIDYDV